MDGIDIVCVCRKMTWEAAQQLLGARKKDGLPRNYNNHAEEIDS